MKPRIVAPIILILCAGFIFLLFNSRPNPYAPRYLPVTTQPTGPVGGMFYIWGSAAPFAHDQLWIYTRTSRTNSRIYLCDLPTRKIIGELTNAGPIFANADQTKLLCEGRDSLDTSLKASVLQLLSTITRGKIHYNTNTVETFWLLNLRNNTARPLGKLSQWAGTGSYWKPAPAFRFGYNVPNNEEEDKSFYLCDLDQETYKKIYLAGNLRGWWDDHQILIKQSDGALTLYDVLTEKSTSLLTSAAIAETFQKLGIDYPTSNLTTQNIWTGSNYDFLLTPKQTMDLYINLHFAIKLNHTDPPLTLLSTNFQYHWLGTFDPTGNFYAYSGESGPPGRGGNGALYVRDLARTNPLTLIPPGETNSGYNIARFWRDTLIYAPNNNELWTMKLDGTQPTRLFPPPEN